MSGREGERERDTSSCSQTEKEKKDGDGHHEKKRGGEREKGRKRGIEKESDLASLTERQTYFENKGGRGKGEQRIERETERQRDPCTV